MGEKEMSSSKLVLVSLLLVAGWAFALDSSKSGKSRAFVQAVLGADPAAAAEELLQEAAPEEVTEEAAPEEVTEEVTEEVEEETAPIANSAVAPPTTQPPTTQPPTTQPPTTQPPTTQPPTTQPPTTQPPTARPTTQAPWTPRPGARLVARTRDPWNLDIARFKCVGGCANVPQKAVMRGYVVTPQEEVF
eukprot:TRINITY_DN1318_c0_g1_i5.p1 TRINITY_DN1318_c0_g1~~TRINITY_DN1318_c0_g1_i5.p1  ORF type:complete len:200 (+),score=56.15 TRINITY_DN1318_c0_g1_i5:33-602(+)